MPDTTPSLPPFSPTMALLTMARGSDDALADALKPLGLTARKFGLLGHVRSVPGISFSELARRARITVQSTHAVIAALEVDGLVRDETARAGAASRLQVTPAGERAIAGAARILADLDVQFAAQHPELADALAEWMRKARGDRI